MEHNQMYALIPGHLPVIDSKKYKTSWEYDADSGDVSQKKEPLKIQWARYFDTAVNCIINGQKLAMVAEFSDYHEKFLGSATKAVRKAVELAGTHKVTTKSEEICFEVVATLEQVPFVAYASKRIYLSDTLVPVEPGKQENFPGLMFLRREQLKTVTVWSSTNSPEQNRLLMIEFKAQHLPSRESEASFNR